MTSPDPVWLDRMYNNRALVPDFAVHFARWQRDSLIARTTLPCTLDVAYGAAPSEAMDIFPAQAGPAGKGAPVLFFIHGGYWRSLDKSDHSLIAPELVKKGACVVVANYALCPGSLSNPVTIPDITLQMVKALAWVYRNIDKFGGDPSRITVVGHSAGGHLAAMMMAVQWQIVGRDLPAKLAKNGMSISGLFELESVRQTPFLEDSLRLTPAHAKKCSPAWMPNPGVVAGRGLFYSVAGGLESAEFLRHNGLIQTAWGRQTVPVCEALPGLNHFSIVESLPASGSRLSALLLELLRL